MSTIVAISTAPGMGGIGIIRLSGENCFEIINKIFIAKNPQKIDEIEGYRMKYGKIINPESKKIIDEVLVSYFKAPKSYTAENMCEINSHGGMIVLKKILEVCLSNGAVLAEPGEFSKRAFLNGRIDLTQAEAIIDLINAKSSKEAQESANQLEGYLSKKINKSRDELLDLMVNIEANIDYPEYDVEEVSYKNAEEMLEKVKTELEELSKNFENGKIIKDGIKLSIIGSPNAGKSSLLNRILKEERAIVTDIEGTTRDLIEEQVLIEGIPFKIIDTAGIRKTDNMIEQIGIEKSKKSANESDVVIAVFDNSKKLEEQDKEILNIIKDKRAIVVLNKIDLKEQKQDVLTEEQVTGKKIVKISAKNDIGIEKIYKELVNMFNLSEIESDNNILITNVRHQDLISKAIVAINESIEEIKRMEPIDIISIKIKEILENLGEITGNNVSEDLIKSIFSKFCLGK
jgi:tRNA modification GTPase